jgi:predicted SAM-dependent methyltransferase
MLEGTFRSYFGAVAVPILDKGDGTISNVTHDWANAMAALSGGLAVTILRLQIRNYRSDVAKERLAEMALANHCDFVYFADDDVIPPPDTLIKMVRLWRSDPKYKIISGIYWSKSDPPVPLVFKGNLEGSYWDWKTTDLFIADGAGAGMLFVDTEVFKKIPKPWFSCNYFFEDPRTEYDLQKWNLTDQLGAELLKGKNADKNKVRELEKQLEELGEKIKRVEAGELDPNTLKNKKADPQTTEDLYFFKKAKEYGYDLWIDASIQGLHQDKRTGRTFGLTPDMPQAHPRYEGRFQRGDKIVLDLGCGDVNYWIPEGKPIRVDINPQVNPDVIADVRFLPFEDCFADQVNASHILEHFSFRETISVLREWIRVLKIGGRLIIVVPNLKWAAKRILNPPKNADEIERAMFFYYSAQKGDLKRAYEDVHRSGFTPETLRNLLTKLGTLKDIEIYTTDGNFGNWNEPHLLKKDDSGYNIIAFATKQKHDVAVSLKLPIKAQEELKYNIGEKSIEEAQTQIESKASKLRKKRKENRERR